MRQRFTEVDWIGEVRGWRPKNQVAVGTLVKKTGRTTNFTTGRITEISATVDVDHGGPVHAGTAQGSDHHHNISALDDSGSLVLTLDDVAVGLLFAGSSIAMIANRIENVRALLRAEVTERML